VIFSPFDVGFGIEAENQSQNFNGVCLYWYMWYST
jgi:hypothetical protein